MHIYIIWAGMFLQIPIYISRPTYIYIHSNIHIYYMYIYIHTYILIVVACHPTVSLSLSLPLSFSVIDDHGMLYVPEQFKKIKGRIRKSLKMTWAARSALSSTALMCSYSSLQVMCECKYQGNLNSLYQKLCDAELTRKNAPIGNKWMVYVLPETHYDWHVYACCLSIRTKADFNDITEKIKDAMLRFTNSSNACKPEA